MDTQKKHSLSGAIIIASCFLLVAGACENGDGIDTGDQAKNVPLSFNASTTGITLAETRSFDYINAFTGNSYTFGLRVTKADTGNEVFPGSGDFTGKMERASSTAGWQWSYSKKDGSPVVPHGPEGKPMKVIAYYPVGSETGAFITGIPFDFTATVNPKQTEILYNTNTSYTINSIPAGGEATIPLHFQHAYSWIVINVTKYVDQGGTFTLTDVAIDNLSGEWIKNEGFINPETGLVTKDSKLGPIGETRAAQALDTTTPIRYEFLVPAFMDAGVKDEDIVFSLNVNDHIELFPIKREQLNQDGDKYGFRQGYKNTYNLEFNNSALNLRLLNWTSVSIGDGVFFGADQSNPTNYVAVNYNNYLGDGRKALWTTAANGYAFPTQKYKELSLGTHKFGSYFTTVSYGANGTYVEASPITDPPPKGGIIIDDDANVALMEEVYWKFQMTTEDINIEPVPWEDENGQLAAKEICRKYNGGGHHDWRLPRASELRALFIYMVYNSGTGTQLDRLNFNKDANLNKFYWTGTEMDEEHAWAMYYRDESKTVPNKKGPVIAAKDKKEKCAVRCIRELD